jgi:6-phosphofructokinase 1
MDRLAILVGGGPAPGINGVIGSVTEEAIKRGLEEIGIYDGFRWISRSSFEPSVHTVKLDMDTVSGIHFHGGSILRTSRDSLIKTGVTPDEDKVGNVRKAMEGLGIRYLVTIGGDDTAFSASIVARSMEGKLYVAHVPKTIDNDLPLPGNMPTFGFQTARHLATQLLQNIMEDARITSRWYFVVAMGRSAGHLALGMGKAANATLTIIPEEFGEKKIMVKDVCDIIEGSMIKRKAMGRDDGVAVVAEGVALKFGEVEELEAILGKPIPRDPHGNPRLAEVPLGDLLKSEMERRFSERGEKITIVTKDIGYELRCAAPIPFDMEYTRDLGHGAVRYLLGDYPKEIKEKGAMISIVDGRLNPIPFDQIIDPRTGRTAIRTVDINSDSYLVARSYMIRLERSDFEDPDMLERLAKAAKLSVEEFRKRFEGVVR